MQGFVVRLACALNFSLGHRGKIFKKRFHHQILKTPQQIHNTLTYVLCNTHKHHITPTVSKWLDPFSSASSFPGWETGGEREPAAQSTALPRTWLLRIGWRRAGTLHPDHTPGPLT